ncbi:hypothetical protein F5Y15DRAFT_418798 [Xylariaceae sp. FL0016]|nr:hypothetical protein F5Y15DRAFT_418798 [Xylariaceae sp. FL0016]
MRPAVPDSFGFGLDGQVLTREEATGTSEGILHVPEVSSRQSSPQGDPKALLKVKSKQATAERKARKRDLKQLKRQKKEERRGNLSSRRVQETGNGEKGVRFDHRPGQSMAGVGSEAEGPRRSDKDKGKGKDKERAWDKKTESGFVVRQTDNIKLKHPKAQRPGSIKKIVNMYKEKSSSGGSLGKASSARSLVKTSGGWSLGKLSEGKKDG